MHFQDLALALFPDPWPLNPSSGLSQQEIRERLAAALGDNVGKDPLEGNQPQASRWDLTSRRPAACPRYYLPLLMGLWEAAVS